MKMGDLPSVRIVLCCGEDTAFNKDRHFDQREKSPEYEGDFFIRLVC